MQMLVNADANADAACWRASFRPGVGDCHAKQADAIGRDPPKIDQRNKGISFLSRALETAPQLTRYPALVRGKGKASGFRR